jgi:integrase
MVYDLLSQMKAQSKSRFVFPMRDNPNQPTCETGIYKSFNTAKRRAGVNLDYSPHDFRHTWNTAAHMDPKATDAQRERFAGSKTLVQKNTYVHLKVENLRPLLNVVKVEGAEEIVKTKAVDWGKSWGKRK